MRLIDGMTRVVGCSSAMVKETEAKVGAGVVAEPLADTIGVVEVDSFSSFMDLSCYRTKRI